VTNSADPSSRVPFVADDGRTVIVALDHALVSGQVPGLTRPGALLRRLAGARPDGFIVPMGMGGLSRAAAPDVPWLLTADVYTTSTLPGGAGEHDVHAVVWSAAAAARAGASGLKVLLVFGRRDPGAFERELRDVAGLISSAREVGLPVMVETVLWGPAVADGDDDDAKMVVDAARTGFELGADVLKIAVPDDLGPLRELTSGLPVPIVLMGGPANDPAAMFASIDAALDAGAAGVALGRNVWTHTSPVDYVEALHRLVHGREGPARALAGLDPA
jgi:DhnA family fructose-bisphosphate aldolase class Ia